MCALMACLVYLLWNIRLYNKRLIIGSSLMLIKRVDDLFQLENLREDARKLGVNFITGGAGTLFIARSTALTIWIVIAAICVILTGIALTLGGSYKGFTNELK